MSKVSVCVCVCGERGGGGGELEPLSSDLPFEKFLNLPLECMEL